MTVRYVSNLGARTAYEVLGTGPHAVVLQHPFLRSRKVWKDFGYVEALAPHFTLIAIDSLAHGESSQPLEASRYLRPARTTDIAAILDAEGIPKAHYVGYSMGGWLGIGMLAHQSPRLLSLTLGAFDPEPGSMPSPSFDQFFAMAAKVAPDAVAGVPPEAKPALALCFDAIKVRDISADVVRKTRVPLHLWTGADDTTHAPFKALHEAIAGSTLSVVPGNHAGAMSAPESVQVVREFLFSL